MRGAAAPIDGRGAWFLVKMKQTPNLVGVVWATKRWKTVERDAVGQPTRQVAEIAFEREGWPPGKWRVFAVRTNERLSGNQSCLWNDLDFSVHVYATNDHAHDATSWRGATTIAPASRRSSPS